jgi:hypothetical protein
MKLGAFELRFKRVADRVRSEACMHGIPVAKWDAKPQEIRDLAKSLHQVADEADAEILQDAAR